MSQSEKNVETHHGALTCSSCNERPEYLYELDGRKFCEECAEGKLRRQRFEEEEEEWNKSTTHLEEK